MKYFITILLLLWLTMATIFLIYEKREVDKLEDRIVQLESYKKHLIHRINKLEQSELVFPFSNKIKEK